MTPNEIFIDYLSNELGFSFGDSLVFWIFGFAIAMVIFFLLRAFTDFTKSVTLIISFAPMIIIDAIVSFGEYTFKLPLISDITVHNLVMTFSVIDYIFGFGLFNYAKDIIIQYNADVVSTSLLTKIITFLLSVGDSLIQIVLFSLTAYYVISIIEYHFNREFSWQVPISIAIGFIPVFFYALFFSNPVEEFKKSNYEVSGIMYFFDNAKIDEIVITIILGFISFLLVFLVISVVIRFFLSSAITFIPRMQEYQWRTSYLSVAFLTTLIYTFLYVMHPDYKWYIIIMVIIVWSGFRSFMKDLSTSARLKTFERREKRRQIAGIVREIVNYQRDPSSYEKHFNKNEGNMKFQVIVILIGLILILTGILIFVGVLWT